MKADQYALEVEYLVYQAQNGTLSFDGLWQRLTLLTISYRTEGPCYHPFHREDVDGGGGPGEA